MSKDINRLQKLREESFDMTKGSLDDLVTTESDLGLKEEPNIKPIDALAQKLIDDYKNAVK